MAKFHENLELSASAPGAEASVIKACRRIIMVRHRKPRREVRAEESRSRRRADIHNRQEIRLRRMKAEIGRREAVGGEMKVEECGNKAPAHSAFRTSSSEIFKQGAAIMPPTEMRGISKRAASVEMPAKRRKRRRRPKIVKHQQPQWQNETAESGERARRNGAAAQSKKIAAAIGGGLRRCRRRLSIGMHIIAIVIYRAGIAPCLAENLP